MVEVCVELSSRDTSAPLVASSRCITKTSARSVTSSSTTVTLTVAVVAPGSMMKKPLSGS